MDLLSQLDTIIAIKDDDDSAFSASSTSDSADTTPTGGSNRPLPLSSSSSAAAATPPCPHAPSPVAASRKRPRACLPPVYGGCRRPSPARHHSDDDECSGSSDDGDQSSGSDHCSSDQSSSSGGNRGGGAHALDDVELDLSFDEEDGRPTRKQRRSSLKRGAGSRASGVRWATGNSVTSLIKIPSLTELDPHVKGELWYDGRDFSMMAESEMERRMRMGERSSSALIAEPVVQADDEGANDDEEEMDEATLWF